MISPSIPTSKTIGSNGGVEEDKENNNAVEKIRQSSQQKKYSSMVE